MRNAAITTIAPTGTISLFADCNGGIEPFFALSYTRKNMETLEGEEIIYVNKILEQKLKDRWLYTKKMMDKISKSGKLPVDKNISENLQRIFKTALEIDPSWHLRMQAAFQKYTDNAVSKTINVEYNTTPQDIEKIFITAHELKLKGVTVFRDKSRDKQVLNTK